jgi:hypothetical protein
MSSSKNIDYHSFKPLPHGLCMVCDGKENEIQHRQTKDIYNQMLETKTDHPEGNDREQSNDSTTTTTTTKNNNATNGSTSENSNNRNTKNNVTDSTNTSTSITNNHKIHKLDNINVLYSWGEPSRLGACTNKYYRSNKEHRDASVRKKKGTHLWTINRATHPMSHQVPLEVDLSTKDQTLVQIACSEKHSDK